MRGRHEMVGADDLAVLGDHAQQNLEMRRAAVAAQRHDQLRIELQPVSAMAPRRSLIRLMSVKRRTMLSSAS